MIWHVLREGVLVRVGTDADGIYRSAAFPGLWLRPGDLLARDLAALIDLVAVGVATPEHAAFVAKLEAQKRGA